MVAMLLQWKPDMLTANQVGHTARDIAGKYEELKSRPFSGCSMVEIWHLLGMEPLGVWEFDTARCGVQRLMDKKKVVYRQVIKEEVLTRPGPGARRI